VGSTGDIPAVREALNLMHLAGIKNNRIAYNIALECCSKAGDLKQLKEVAIEMLDRGIQPDKYTLSSVFKVFLFSFPYYSFNIYLICKNTK